MRWPYIASASPLALNGAAYLFELANGILEEVLLEVAGERRDVRSDDALRVLEKAAVRMSKPSIIFSTLRAMLP